MKNRMVLAILGIGLGASLFAIARTWETRWITAGFNSDASRHLERLTSDIAAATDAAELLARNLLTGGETARLDPLARRVLESHPLLAAFGWAPRTENDNAGFPVAFIEPAAGYGNLIGRGLATTPEHRAALRRIRDSGEATALFLGPSSAPLLIIPVYDHKPGTPPRTGELRGYALGALSVPLLATRNGEPGSRVWFQVINRDAAPGEPETLPAQFADTAAWASSLRFERRMTLGGRPLSVVAVADKDYINDHRTWIPWGVLFTAWGGALGGWAGAVALKNRTGRKTAPPSGVRPTVAVDADVRPASATEAPDNNVSLLRMALETAKLGTWQHRIDAGIFELDCWAAQICRQEKRILSNDAFLALIHPDDRGLLLETMACCNQKEAPGSPVVTEVRAQFPDGSIAHWHFTAQTRFTGRGDRRVAAFAVGTVQDVTSQRMTEAGLAEIDEMNRLIVSDSTMAIAVFEQDGATVLFNNAYLQMIGADQEQVKQQNFRAIKTWQASSLLKHALETLETGAPCGFTEHLVTTFGREIWADISLARISRGGSPHLLLIGTDSTRRVLTEKAMARQANRLQVLLKTAGDGLHVLEEDGTLLQASDSFYAMLGYDPADPPKLNVRDWDAHFSEAQLSGELTHLFDTRKPIFFQTRHRCKNGSIIDVEISAQGTMFDDQRLLFASSRNITARIAAENAQKAAEAKFRALVEQSLAGIYIIQGEYFRYVNPQFATLFGYDDPDEIVDKVKVAELIRPGDRETVAGNIRKRLSGEVVQVRYSFAGLRRDRREIVVEVHGRSFSYDGAPAIIGLTTDVTEQRRAENALHDLLAKQKAILGGIPIGIAVSSVDRVILEANDAFLNIFRCTTDIIGHHIEPAYLDDGIFEHIGKSAYPLITGGGIYREDLHVRRTDGGDVWTRVVGTLVDVHHPDLGIVWVLEDISERKNLELELKRSNTDLEQFAYIASHDLRQPLRAINSYLGLMKRGLDNNLSDEMREYFAFVTGGAQRLDQLIVDLLDYSRTGRNAAPAEPVAVDQVIEECRLNLAVAIMESGAEIDIATVPLPTVVGRESELIRLFQNLIGNAIKYHAPNRPPHVTIGSYRDKDEIVITVQDNGIGIDTKDHERVFAVFQRLVAKDEYEGTGIGLAIVKKIVSHHNGRIWIVSRLGDGSTFHIAFPNTMTTTGVSGTRQNLPGNGQNLPPN